MKAMSPMTLERAVLHIGLPALQRIARKPITAGHKSVREFVPKPGYSNKASVRLGDKINDPLFLPKWAEYELNPCDCARCIAIRTIAEIKESTNAH